MAILRERLNRRNTDGSYDIIHLETNASIVTMADGTSLQVKIDDIVNQMNNISAPTITNAETASKLATPRSFQVNLSSSSAVNFDGSANVTPGVTGVLPIEYGGTGKNTASLAMSSMIGGCPVIAELDDTDTIPINDSSASTCKSVSLGSLITYIGNSNQMGTAIENQTVKSAAVGDKIKWAGVNWLVVHRDTTAIYLGLLYVTETMNFPNGSTWNSKPYANNKMALRCVSWLNETIQAQYHSSIINYTVEGVTAKCWVPSTNLIYGGLSHYGVETNRIAYSAEGGAAIPWWLSTPHQPSSDVYMYGITTSGAVSSGYSNSELFNSSSAGFRPHIAIAL